jgi:hypothetical protein
MAPGGETDEKHMGDVRLGFGDRAEPGLHAASLAWADVSVADVVGEDEDEVGAHPVEVNYGVVEA